MNRLSKLPSQDSNMGTFVLTDEGHTLGNALTSIIREYREIELCGYTVPHPSDNKINLHIQTKGKCPIEVLTQAFKDLEKICDITIQRFEEAHEKFKSKDTPPADTSV